MSGYTADDARRDLAILRESADADTSQRLADYIARIEARAESAETVCVAAVEISSPTVKRDQMQQRQTRFLRALAEWRHLEEQQRDA